MLGVLSQDVGTQLSQEEKMESVKKEKRMREINIEHLDTFVMATLLDPRFKGNFFRSEEAKKNGERKLLEL